MTHRVERILEYDKIKAQVAGFCCSNPGRQRCLLLHPFWTFEEVEQALLLTMQAESAMLSLGQNPMISFEDCAEGIKRCAVGAVPTIQELLQVAQLLRAAQHVHTQLEKAATEGGLQAFAHQLWPLPALFKEITRCIVNEEELADDASQALFSIRRAIRRTEEAVRARQQSILTGQATRQMLQQPIITQRNGRYVVPVKIEYASQIKGFEHDRSGSGQTVYIEPFAVLQANNERKEWQAKEQQEIARILASLGQSVGGQAENMLQNLETLTALDVVFAKVGWGKQQKAQCPQLITQGRMRVKKARHPLLEANVVVPIDYELDEDIRALLITGPNTGGKTVSLKTMGLFVLLMQTGLFLPCEKAEMPVYTAVYADIGDEQSIEQSLSTFSSHMVQIVSILEQAGYGQLVLLDELGAGTDPVEGAALAIAILETLAEHGAVVACTTHYSELKSYAMTHEGFINAGMEFDTQSLRPTFQLLFGYASSSNAFAISRRLGLPEQVIEKAQSHVQQETASLEQALARAEQLRKQTELQKQQTEQELEMQKQAVQKELLEQQRQAGKLMQKANQTIEKAKRTLEEAKEQASDAIEQAKQAARAENRAEREKLLHQARETLKQMPALSVETEPALKGGVAPKEVMPGQTVFSLTLNAEATAISRPNEKGEVQVQAGLIKATVPLSSLRIKGNAAPKSSANVVRQDNAVPLELDVRGCTVEEARMLVDLHLDQAVLAGRRQTTIIHGKGTGALRNGLKAHLRGHPHVKGMRDGVYGEGDTGVTVVELK